MLYNRLLFAVGIVSCFLLNFEAGFSQDDHTPGVVLGPGDFTSHPNSFDSELVFKPLAPQFSDYWKGVMPQALNLDMDPVTQAFPMPPLPIVVNDFFVAKVDESTDAMGSGLLADPLFWQGANYYDGKWELYTIPTSLYSQSFGDPVHDASNWHNLFQHWVVGTGHLHDSFFPPMWPSSGVVNAEFTDWVDLYAPYLSRAFFDDYSGFEISNSSNFDATVGFGRYGFPRVGSPQHVDLPPTYPPIANDVWSSTSPLVPASGGDSTGVYTKRQSLVERLDLITGEPLLSETDLSLEFGSAIFRRIRTYAERPDHGIKADIHRQVSNDIRSWTRGWHGSGWMSSEVPLFFFDASQAGTITTGQEDQIGPVCYFVPDAHHSIPFIQQDRGIEMPDYIAPDWFDAMLLYDKNSCEWGEIDPGTPESRMGWITPPVEMKVYLHNRSVIYTIKMYYEDVDPVQHKRPLVDVNGMYSEVSKEYNYGVPYYGLVTRIEDKPGNRVEITYVDAEKHKPFWDPDPDARLAGMIDTNNDSVADTVKIMPVRQRGWYKGMIDYIKLYPSGSDMAKWSLFYTYRTFYSGRGSSHTFFHPGNDRISDYVNYFDYLSHAPALHSLLVYKNDVLAPGDREIILPCDSTTYGPAEHVLPSETPPAFVDLLIDRRMTQDSEHPTSILGVSAKPIVGSHPNRFDYQDVEVGPTGHGSLEINEGLPESWEYQVRFSYADPVIYGEFYDAVEDKHTGLDPRDDHALRSCGPIHIGYDYSLSDNRLAAYLLKTSRLQRTTNASGGSDEFAPRFWLYRYQDVVGSAADQPHPYRGVPGYDYWSYGTHGISMPRRMSHRYGPETIGRIYRNRPPESDSCDLNSFVNRLIGMDEDRYVTANLCDAELPDPPDPQDPPSSDGINPGIGGIFDYDDSMTPYNTINSGGIHTSSTQSLSEQDTNNLPIGLLADTIYYRWSEPYRLDPRLLTSADPGPSGFIARPASWELFDGRYAGSPSGLTNFSKFFSDLRNVYVGASISPACETISSLVITQAGPEAGFLPGGAGVFSTIGDDGNVKWYRVYRFIDAPDTPSIWKGSNYPSLGPQGLADPLIPRGPEVIWDPTGLGSDGVPGDHPSNVPALSIASHSLYYYPFNFTSNEWGLNNYDAITVRRQLSEPMWWTVVDEFDSIEEALSENSSMAYPSDDSSGDYNYSEYASPSPWNSRRVIAIAPGGQVLSDRTWTNAGDDASVGDPPAILDAWSYDQHMRPLYHYTKGWGAAAAEGFGATNGDYPEVDNGLVEVYSYHEAYVVNMGSPGHGADDVFVTLAPRTPFRKSIRKGCGGVDMPISLIEYFDDPDSGDTTPKEWKAKLPKTERFYNLLGTEIGTIEHYYGHWDDTSRPAEEEPAQPQLRWSVRAGPGYQRFPSAPTVRSIDGQWFNEKGQLVWRVYGAMTDPIPDDDGHLKISTADEVFLDYHQYDKDGREVLIVEDISIDGTGEGFGEEDLVFAGHPTDAAYANQDPDVLQPFWQNLSSTPNGNLFVGGNVPADDLSSTELSELIIQIGSDQSTLIGTSMYRQAEANPLNLVIFRAYNDLGLSKVVHPSGLRDLMHYEVHSAALRELRAMGATYDADSGSWQFAGQGLFDSEFNGGAFVDGIQAALEDLADGVWSGSPEQLEALFNDARLEVIANITPSYDTAGRLTGLTVADDTQSADPIKSAISYDGWGNPLLEISPDRLIKRYKYDGLGRLHKIFVGTNDRHTIWRTSTEEDEDDDLILTEKLYYGTSPTDAFLPITKWAYRDKSDTQYDMAEFYEASDDQAGTGTAFEVSDMPVGDSSPGRVEHYGYDWRMRKVSTKYEDFESDNPGVYREERVFYDNLDRVRYTLVYSPEATEAAPSPNLDPVKDLPAPSEIIAAGANVNLLSFEETVYNGAGQVTERRRYDPQGSGGYLTAYSFNDHADRAIWSSSSSGRITKNIYDAKGRMVSTSEYAGNIEMSRAENVYGPDDRIQAVKYFERIGGPENASENGIDAVAHRLTVSYTWYDTAGRVIVAADMGSTEFDPISGQYVRTIPARPGRSPEVTAKLSGFMTLSSSTSERHILVGVEYPDAFFDSMTGDASAKLTCYWYDRLGKQNAVLSVVSAHRDVTAGDISIQYTIDRIEYNRYGQKVLEHKYAYTGDGSSHLDSDFQLLNGMEYTYEADVFLQGDETPRTVTTTQVRTITPLNTDEAVMAIKWEDHNLGNGEVGKGRFYPDWLDPSERRTTILEYGAPIIDPDYSLPQYVLHPTGPVQFPIESNDWGHIGISNRPDLIKAVHLPNPTGGGTGDGLGYSMFFFYYPDGLPAIRVDSRGVGIKYVYDADGNLIRLSSDDINIPLLDENPSMADAQRPTNAIEYTYDALSRLMSVTTGRDFSDGTFWRRSRSELAYTSLGNLDSETQRRYTEYDDPTNPNPLLETAGTVDYTWDTRLLYESDPTQPVQVVSNLSRLQSITYPDRVGTHDNGAYSPRVVTLRYGPEGGISDLLDRVETLKSTGGPTGAEIGHVATYRYDGLNRLGGVDLGDVPGQSTQTFVQTDDRDFDIFGRVIDRQVMGFDVGSGQHQQIMHSQFGYDLRGDRIYERLTQFDHPSQGSRDNTHSSFFDYDTLGRLVGEHYGSLKADGFAGIDHASSLIDPLALTYGLDSLNRRVGISSAPGISIWEDANKNEAVDPGELLTQTQEIDARGGLTGLYDGSVTEAVAQDESGAITGLHGRKLYHDWLGRPILVLQSDDTAVFAVDYDGFGRMAQRRAPWPGTDPEDGIQRIETYFYDGVRRIQEVFDDPKAATPPWPVGIPIGGFGGGGGSSGPEQRTEAEYIWSAASGQPFDTCHVQIDWWDREAWFVQDHQTATVRAYTDANGEMVRQYRFDAFGNLLNLGTFPLASNGNLFANFRNRLGHQGLFAERVDEDTTHLTLSPNPGAELWYQNRSRWYVPELGRFLSSDPNETGIPTMQSLSMLGRVPTGPPSGSFGWEGHYGDGWDTFTAYGANPVMGQDPSGLGVLSFFGDLAIRLNLGWRAAQASRVGYIVAEETIATWTGGYAAGLIGGGSLAGASLLDDVLALPAGKIHRHHIFPQNWRVWFSQRGVFIDDFIVELGQRVHLAGVHGRGNGISINGAALPGGWNGRWAEFINNNPDATSREIFQFGGMLMDEFGLSDFAIIPFR